MFQKLTNLLKERAQDRALLRDAKSTANSQRIWEEEAIQLFPESIQEHVRSSVRIGRLEGEQLRIEVRDPYTKQALLLQQQKLLTLFQSHDLQINRLHLTTLHAPPAKDVQ